MDRLIVFAGSLLAILAVYALVRWLGLGSMAIRDADDANQMARQGLPGFAAEDALVSTDGMAALVKGADGRFALIKCHGAHPALRTLPQLSGVQRSGSNGHDVHIDSGDRSFGAIRLTLDKSGEDKLLTWM